MCKILDDIKHSLVLNAKDICREILKNELSIFLNTTVFFKYIENKRIFIFLEKSSRKTQKTLLITIMNSLVISMILKSIIKKSLFQ